MNKITIGIILLIIIIGGFVLFGSGGDDADSEEPRSDEENSEEASNIDEIPVEDFSNLDSSDSVFTEIDNAIEVIE
jgi:hypothetical protein